MRSYIFFFSLKDCILIQCGQSGGFLQQSVGIPHDTCLLFEGALNIILIQYLNTVYILKCQGYIMLLFLVPHLGRHTFNKAIQGGAQPGIFLGKKIQNLKLPDTVVLQLPSFRPGMASGKIWLLQSKNINNAPLIPTACHCLVPPGIFVTSPTHCQPTWLCWLGMRGVSVNTSGEQPVEGSCSNKCTVFHRVICVWSYLYHYTNLYTEEVCNRCINAPSVFPILSSSPGYCAPTCFICVFKVV